MSNLLDNPHATPPAKPPQETDPPDEGVLIPAGLRKTVPWRGRDVLVIFMMWLALQFMGGALAEAIWPSAKGASAASAGRFASTAQPVGPGKPHAKRPADPDRILLGLVASGVASLLGLGLGIGWLRQQCRASWADLGLSVHRLRYDAITGIVGFLIVMVPIFGLTAVLRLLFPDQPDHPIVTLLTHRPGIVPLAVCGLAAVAVAPVVEEFLCRGVFQGWLQRLAVEHWHDARRDGLAAPIWTVLLPSADKPRVMLGPILISAVLFAGLHLPHGIDPYPLVLLAIALGYLYQRSGRLWPCIVLHATLNAVSLVILWVTI